MTAAPPRSRGAQRWPLWSAVTGLTLAACTGCGEQRPATFPVEGHVLFRDGTPVTSGVVEFQSVEHRVNARGTIGPDGGFRLSTFREGDGAVAGRQRVVVVQLLVAQADRAVQHDHAPGAGHTPKPVHPKHAKYDTSELEFEVSAEQPNAFAITVEAAP